MGKLTFWMVIFHSFHSYKSWICSGWWYTYPSEKYESQLWWLFPIYMGYNVSDAATLEVNEVDQYSWAASPIYMGNKSHVPNQQPAWISPWFRHWTWEKTINGAWWLETDSRCSGMGMMETLVVPSWHVTGGKDQGKPTTFWKKTFFGGKKHNFGGKPMVCLGNTITELREKPPFIFFRRKAGN